MPSGSYLSAPSATSTAATVADGFDAAPVSAEASDDDLAARLWERSAEVVGLFDEVYARPPRSPGGGPFGAVGWSDHPWRRACAFGMASRRTRATRTSALSGTALARDGGARHVAAVVVRRRRRFAAVIAVTVAVAVVRRVPDARCRLLLSFSSFTPSPSSPSWSAFRSSPPPSPCAETSPSSPSRFPSRWRSRCPPSPAALLLLALLPLLPFPLVSFSFSASLVAFFSSPRPSRCRRCRRPRARAAVALAAAAASSSSVTRARSSRPSRRRCRRRSSRRRPRSPCAGTSASSRARHSHADAVWHSPWRVMAPHVASSSSSSSVAAETTVTAPSSAEVAGMHVESDERHSHVDAVWHRPRRVMAEHVGSSSAAIAIALSERSSYVSDSK